MNFHLCRYCSKVHSGSHHLCIFTPYCTTPELDTGFLSIFLSLLFTLYGVNKFCIIQENPEPTTISGFILDPCTISVVCVSDSVWWSHICITDFWIFVKNSLCWSDLMWSFTNYSVLLETRWAIIRPVDSLSSKCRWETQLLPCFSDCAWHLKAVMHRDCFPFGTVFTPSTTSYQETLYPCMGEQTHEAKRALKKAGGECVDLYL